MRSRRVTGITVQNFTWWILFFPNLAVEEVPNHEFLLGHSHFAYVLPLSNHTSLTAKLGKKGSTPYKRRIIVTARESPMKGFDRPKVLIGIKSLKSHLKFTLVYKLL